MNKKSCRCKCFLFVLIEEVCLLMQSGKSTAIQACALENGYKVLEVPILDTFYIFVHLSLAFDIFVHIDIDEITSRVLYLAAHEHGFNYYTSI